MYRIPTTEVLRYQVDYAWEVRTGERQPLHEYIEGTADLSYENRVTDRGLALQGRASNVHIRKSSAKAPPLSKDTWVNILLSPRGQTLGLKWNGMVLPFRCPFWLCFPAGEPAPEWQEDVDVGLPRLEELRFPLHFEVQGSLQLDPFVVRISHHVKDSEASVDIDGEVAFSRSRGVPTRTMLSAKLRGKTNITARAQATLVEAAAEEEEVFLFAPR
ncbi:MAG TPA: hypothetical protein VGO93_20950 [Candidatus Xenobia bacterium]|jgi:hypothetical protein